VHHACLMYALPTSFRYQKSLHFMDLNLNPATLHAIDIPSCDHESTSCSAEKQPSIIDPLPVLNETDLIIIVP
jgi:hypothetical protein